VCDRRAIHYDPKSPASRQTNSSQSLPFLDESNVDAFLSSHKKIHQNHKDAMYFVVSV
jgi:hypothetical protein